MCTSLYNVHHIDKKFGKLSRTLYIKYAVLLFHVSCFLFLSHFLCQLEQGESKRKAIPSWLREELEKMERKRRKEMEKEALENARLEGEREQRAAWRDELDSGDEGEDDRRRDRSSSQRREGREERGMERERERERGRERGHSDRESRHRNIRAHRSRSRSPHRV